MIDDSYRILLYGYGNQNKQDDVLGLLLAEKIEKWNKKLRLPIVAKCNYHLNVEDSYLIKDFEEVIFVDSTIDNKIDTFIFEKLEYFCDAHFSTHQQSPQHILFLCNELFKKYPQCFIMKIRGYEFDFMEKPSRKSLRNLVYAYNFMKNYLVELF